MADNSPVAQLERQLDRVIGENEKLKAKLAAVSAEVDRTERLAKMASGDGPAKAFLALGFVAIAGVVRGDG